MPPDPAPTRAPRLEALVAALHALGDRIDREALVSTLAASDVELADVTRYVEENAHGYNRRRVVRAQAFEVLVMTWRPGQGSDPHDHAGSLCAVRVLRGRARESRFEPTRDGRVEARSSGPLCEGEVLVDGSDRIHALSNDDDTDGALVTLHVYAPPLPELRRYAVRDDARPVVGALARTPRRGTPTIAVVGGGFAGTMVAANLLRAAGAHEARVHVVLIDRQASFGEGAAYRTADPRHLLNVPASHMSAWPDAPSDFLDWRRARAPETAAYEFVPRRVYGEYVRSRFVEAAAAAAPSVSAEIRRDHAIAAELREDGGCGSRVGRSTPRRWSWHVATARLTIRSRRAGRARAGGTWMTHGRPSRSGPSSPTSRSCSSAPGSRRSMCCSR